MSFLKKYKIASANSAVCVGLDSDIARLPECVLSAPNPQFAFNKAIIDATADIAAAYKPNYAFYAANGSEGLTALEMTIDYIPDNIPVILDVKTGDIGNTMQQYACAYYDKLGADALTVNALMGQDVIEPLLKYPDKYIFILALTSNKSATDYILEHRLCDRLAADIHKLGGDKAGAVVGATQVSDLSTMRQLMPDSIFLIPGIGAQGGSLEAVIRHAVTDINNPNILINSSRRIIFADSSDNFAAAARRATLDLAKQIKTLLG